MEMVIFIGLQASGKTSFHRLMFQESHIHVGKDQFPNVKNKQRRQTQLIESAFEASKSVVIDNTNPTTEDRQSLIELAKAWKAKIIGYYFESNPKLSISRNQLREGKARVPDVAIFATLKKLERPKLNEGFDKLYYVRLDNELGFQISEWQDETP